MASVCGRPFLAHLLDQLCGAGVRNIILSTGYMGEQIETAFGHKYGPASLRYCRESAPLGTGGALAAAADFCDCDTILAMNGDSYCAADLKEFADRHFACDARISLLLTHVSSASRYGKVTTDSHGHINRFDEKSGDTKAGLINAGIYLIQRPVLDLVPRRRAVSIEREIFPVWVGHGLYGHATTCPFIDIGTPESYTAAENFFRRTKAA